MGEEVRRATDAVVNKLRDYCHSQPDAATVRINGLEWANRPALDIIGSVGFGYDYRCGDAPEAKALSAAQVKKVNIGITFPAFVAPLVLRAFPWIGNLPLKSSRSQGEIRQIVLELGRRIYQNRQEGAKDDKSLMGQLMKLQEAGSSLDEVLDQIVAFTYVCFVERLPPELTFSFHFAG